MERVHQTIGNNIRIFELYENDTIDDDDPWSGILAAVMAATRSTFSTRQLVFGRDAIINTKFLADWNFIRQGKQNIIHQNNVRENEKRKPHTYNVDDEIMFKKHNQTKYGGPEYEVPYKIVTINDNGTVRIKKRKFYDNVNVRNIKPYFR